MYRFVNGFMVEHDWDGVLYKADTLEQVRETLKMLSSGWVDRTKELELEGQQFWLEKSNAAA